MSFFPFDRDILTSSLWFTGTPIAFKVWCYLLLKANPRTGIVEDSDPSIAGQCAVPLAEAIAALDWLASPDPHSRSKELDGRRIVRTPEGIQLVNYLKRRDKDFSTPRVRRHRERIETARNGETGGNTVRNDEHGNEHNGSTDTPLPPKGVADVFAHWQAVMGHATAKLTPGRRKCIDARLRDGYTPDQLKQAVDGCKSSAYHQGSNDRQAVYDDLTLICRSGEKVEQFLGYLRKPSVAVVKAGSASKPSAFPTRSEKNRAEALAFVADMRKAGAR